MMVMIYTKHLRDCTISRKLIVLRNRKPSRCDTMNDFCRTYQNRGDSRTHSVSWHDLYPADGLCVQSLVLCERFKWKINIKRPFMAPSNKQLDSSFCFASLLRFASDRLRSTCSSSGIFRGLLKQRFDGTCVARVCINRLSSLIL